MWGSNWVITLTLPNALSKHFFLNSTSSLYDILNVFFPGSALGPYLYLKSSSDNAATNLKLGSSAVALASIAKAHSIPNSDDNEFTITISYGNAYPTFSSLDASVNTISSCPVLEPAAAAIDVCVKDKMVNSF